MTNTSEHRTIPLPPAHPAPPIAVSPTLAAQMLDISRVTFYRYVMPFVRTGRIQSLRIGKHRKILVQSLTEWAKSKAESEQG